MPSHPAISSCTLSYWLETKSIDSTGWTRTQRSTCLSLELKACPTTPRQLMLFWRLSGDWCSQYTLPFPQHEYTAVDTLHSQQRLQSETSQHQGSGLAPLPVLSTQGFTCATAMSLWGDEHFHFLNGFMIFFLQIFTQFTNMSVHSLYFVTHWHLFTV